MRQPPALLQWTRLEHSTATPRREASRSHPPSPMIVTILRPAHLKLRPQSIRQQTTMLLLMTTEKMHPPNQWKRPSPRSQNPQMRTSHQALNQLPPLRPRSLPPQTTIFRSHPTTMKHQLPTTYPRPSISSAQTGATIWEYVSRRNCRLTPSSAHVAHVGSSASRIPPIRSRQRQSSCAASDRAGDRCTHHFLYAVHSANSVAICSNNSTNLFNTGGTEPSTINHRLNTHTHIRTAQLPIRYIVANVEPDIR